MTNVPAPRRKERKRDRPGAGRLRLGARAFALCALPFVSHCRSTATEVDVTEAERAVLHLRVVDSETGGLLPARVRVERDGAVLSFANHKDPPFCGGSGTSLREVGSGILATFQGLLVWRGEGKLPAGEAWSHPASSCGPKADFSLGFGRFTLTANAGPEYELGTGTAELRPRGGTRTVTLRLTRAIRAPGYLAVDTHLHSSHGSRDSHVSARARALIGLASGLKILIMTDHDVLTDLGPDLAAAFPSGAPAVAFVGTEASLGYLHVNVFPYDAQGQPFIFAAGSANGEPTPKEALAQLQPLRENQLVQLNHPRFAWGAYTASAHCADQPGAAGQGWTDRRRPPPCPMGFDLMEVLSGFTSCDTKMRASTDDFYGLLLQGHKMTATGASDSHTDTRKIAGYPRTYLRVGHDDPARVDKDALVAALRAHAAVASTGPFVRLSARAQGGATYEVGDTAPAPGGPLTLSIEVQFPSWAPVDEVRLVQDGIVSQRFSVARGARGFSTTVEVSGARDTFYTAEASGQSPMPAWIAGDFVAEEGFAPGVLHCPNANGARGMLPFAVTNPIFVDAEGDGRLEFLRSP